MKCPVCDSSRFFEGLDGLSCKRCGYTNRLRGKIIKVPNIKNPKQISISQNYGKTRPVEF